MAGSKEILQFLDMTTPPSAWLGPSGDAPSVELPRYGLTNPERPDVTRPGSLIVDRQGEIRLIRAKESFKVGSTARGLLVAVLEEILDQ